MCVSAGVARHPQRRPNTSRLLVQSALRGLVHGPTNECAHRGHDRPDFDLLGGRRCSLTSDERQADPLADAKDHGLSICRRGKRKPHPSVRLDLRRVDEPQEQVGQSGPRSSGSCVENPWDPTTGLRLSQAPSLEGRQIVVPARERISSSASVRYSTRAGATSRRSPPSHLSSGPAPSMEARPRTPSERCPRKTAASTASRLSTSTVGSAPAGRPRPRPRPAQDDRQQLVVGRVGRADRSTFTVSATTSVTANPICPW